MNLGRVSGVAGWGVSQDGPCAAGRRRLPAARRSAARLRHRASPGRQEAPLPVSGIPVAGEGRSINRAFQIPDAGVRAGPSRCGAPWWSVLRMARAQSGVTPKGRPESLQVTRSGCAGTPKTGWGPLLGRRARSMGVRYALQADQNHSDNGCWWYAAPGGRRGARRQRGSRGAGSEPAQGAGTCGLRGSPSSARWKCVAGQDRRPGPGAPAGAAILSPFGVGRARPGRTPPFPVGTSPGARSARTDS